ncbi:MAG: glycosyltransferase, partial [Bradymonadia bacterium]
MIPAVAHFVWFGSSLPYAYILGVRSAAIRGGFSEVLIHHADELERSPALDEALALPNVALSRLTLETLEKAPIDRSGALVDLFRKLEQPAAKANMMRAAILANQGGVYLDTDTITLKDFDLLRQEHSAFCGAEHIALPSTVKDSRNPLVWAKAGAMLLYRDLCRRKERGWDTFRRVEHLYPAVANNAILASTPQHPFMLRLLNGMLDLSSRQQLVRFALGTKLLQQMVAKAPDECSVLPPELFFPIGPEVSQHWFRTNTAADLDEMLRPHTRLIHWYASVRTKSVIPQL